MPLCCPCGGSLIDEAQSAPEWEVYPNPTICKQCGKDNSAELKEFLIAQWSKPPKRRETREEVDRKLKEFAGKFMMQNGKFPHRIQ